MRSRLLPAVWSNGPACDLQRALVAAATLSSAAPGGHVFVLAPGFECATGVEGARRFAQQACGRDGAYVRLVAMGAGGGGEGAAAAGDGSSNNDNGCARGSAAHQAWLRARLGTASISYESVDVSGGSLCGAAAELLAQAFARDLLLAPPSSAAASASASAAAAPAATEADPLLQAVRLDLPPGDGVTAPQSLDLWLTPHLLLEGPHGAGLPPRAPDVRRLGTPGDLPPTGQQQLQHQQQQHPHEELVAFGGRCVVRLRRAAASSAFVSGGGGGDGAPLVLLRCEAIVPRAFVAIETLVGGPWLLVPRLPAVRGVALPRPLVRVAGGEGGGGEGGGEGGDGGGGGERGGGGGGGGGGALEVEVEMACDDEEDDGGDGRHGGLPGGEGGEEEQADPAAWAAACVPALCALLSGGGGGKGPRVLLASSRSAALFDSGRAGGELLAPALAPALFCIEPASGGAAALVARRVAPREALLPLPTLAAASAAASAAAAFADAADGGGGPTPMQRAAERLGRALGELPQQEGAGGPPAGCHVALPSSGLHEYVARLLWGPERAAGGVRLAAAAAPAPAAVAVAPAPTALAAGAAASASAAAAPQPPPAAGAHASAAAPAAAAPAPAGRRRSSKRVGALPLDRSAAL